MSIRDLALGDEVCVLPMDEQIGIKNDVAARTLKGTGGVSDMTIYPQSSAPASMQGAPLQFPGNNSIAFDGNDYALIKSAQEVYSAISVSFWIELGAVPTSFQCVLGKYRSGGSTNALLIGTNNSGGVKWYIAATGGGLFNSFSTTAPTTSLTHVVVVAEENGADLDLFLYLDGIAEPLSSATFANTSLGLEQDDAWVLGADADAGFSIGNLLPAGTRIQDLCIIRNVALSPAEVAQIYTDGLSEIPIDRSMAGLGFALRLAALGNWFERYPQDISGNANHVTVSEEEAGGIYAPPHIRVPTGLETDHPAMRFEGAQCLDLTDFGMSDDASMVIAFKPSVLSSSQGLFGKHSTSGAAVSNGHNLVQAWLEADGSIRFQLHGDPGEVQTAAGLVGVDQWSTVMVALESVGGVDTIIRVYVNGTLRVEQTVLGRTVNNGPQTFTGAGRRAWTVGQDWETGSRTDFFNGDLMQFMVIDRTFTQAEVLEVDQAIRGELFRVRRQDAPSEEHGYYRLAYETFSGAAEFTTSRLRIMQALVNLGDGGATLTPILSVVSTSPTSIRVTFGGPIVDNIALSSLGSYEVSPALELLSVTPEAVASPTYVDIVTAEQIDGQAYTFEAITYDNNRVQGNFTGQGILPSILSVQHREDNSLLVTFTKEMSINAALTDPSNYTLNDQPGSIARTVVSVSVFGDTQTQVLLTPSGTLTAGADTYELEVGPAVQDAIGNSLDPAGDTLLFSTISVTERLLYLTALNSNTFRVYLNKELKARNALGADDALNPLNWDLSVPSQEVPSPTVVLVEGSGYDAVLGLYFFDVRVSERTLASVTYQMTSTLIIGTALGQGSYVPRPPGVFRSTSVL